MASCINSPHTDKRMSEANGVRNPILQILQAGAPSFEFGKLHEACNQSVIHLSSACFAPLCHILSQGDTGDFKGVCKLQEG